ncbi:MAG: glycosyltransferase, partial [Patescibacteria group bacterium]|nr:glycosyltransferase [Patescibacteria group bacterium]
MKCYVVTPQYLINDHLEKLSSDAIDSFKKTDLIFISVDDAGTQGADMLKKKSDVYLKNKVNSGFAKTCNVGFKWVLENEKDDCYVVCANNDILVYDDWLEEFDKTLKQHNGDMIGGLGFKDKIVEGQPIENYQKNPGSKYSSAYISEGGRLESWMFPGGFWLMKKSVLEDVGLLDENFVHGGYEDIDFFLRCKWAGKRLLITPRVAYWHEEGATRFGEQEAGRQAGAEIHNKDYCLKKHNFEPHENIL